MKGLPPSLRHGLGIAGIYAALSGIWVALSDRLAERLFPDPSILTQIQTFKGAGFVALTASVIMILVRRAMERELATRDALREQQDLHRATVEQASVGIAHVGLDGRWLMLNQRFCEIVGWRCEDLLQRHFADITHPDDHSADDAAMRRMLSGESQSSLIEKRYLRPDGQAVWIMLSVRLVRHHRTGQPLFFICVIQDIGDRKLADQRLQAALEEKEALLGEVHHRVRNNLQVVISMLALEAGKVTDPAMHKAFDDALARIHAIGLIHQQLYEKGDFARMDFGDYARKLTEVLHTAMAPQHVHLVFDLEPFQCSTDQAIPMAMILVELVMNAFKHAFPDGRPGTVTTRLHHAGSADIVLEVEDDGIGAPDPAQKGTGLTLCNLLTRQLDGDLSHGRTARGTLMRLKVAAGQATAQSMQ